MPGITTPNGIDADDMDRIKRFLDTPAWDRTPEMLCPEEQRK